jgi:hypothetical protein
MTTTSNLTAVRTSNSSDRIPVLSQNGARAHASKSTVAKLGGAARRLMSALMQSLAAPHI